MSVVFRPSGGSAAVPAGPGHAGPKVWGRVRKNGSPQPRGLYPTASGSGARLPHRNRPGSLRHRTFCPGSLRVSVRGVGQGCGQGSSRRAPNTGSAAGLWPPADETRPNPTTRRSDWGFGTQPGEPTLWGRQQSNGGLCGIQKGRGPAARAVRGCRSGVGDPSHLPLRGNASMSTFMATAPEPSGARIRQSRRSLGLGIPAGSPLRIGMQLLRTGTHHPPLRPPVCDRVDWNRDLQGRR